MPHFKSLLLGLLCLAALQGAPGQKTTPSLPSDSPSNTPPPISTPNLNDVPKIHLGNEDERDPFGVEYNGPFDKNPHMQTGPSDSHKVTLKMIVDALTIQGIFPESSEALINSNLLKQGDQIIIKWLSETSTVTLKKVEENVLHFTWATDDKEVIYHAPVDSDIFAPVESDPMKALNQPAKITINLTPALGDQNKNNPFNNNKRR